MRKIPRKPYVSGEFLLLADELQTCTVDGAD